jgi:hypothetical protein
MGNSFPITYCLDRTLPLGREGLNEVDRRTCSKGGNFREFATPELRRTP